MEGAELELLTVKEALQKSLEDKEQETRCTFEIATPLHQQQRVQSDIHHMRQGVEKILQCVSETFGSNMCCSLNIQKQ